MKSLIFYTGLILILEYFLGFGLTKKILPKTLTKYALIMSPWVLNIFVIIVMVEGSLLGVPGKWIAVVLAVMLGVLTLSVLRGFRIHWWEVILGAIVLASVVFNNSPLVLRDKSLTTISLGNNDVIAYAVNSDYLVGNSISGSFSQNVSLTIDNLLHDGYRWGTPLLQTFFLTLTRTPAWKMTYLIQTILFSTMLPLGYIIYLLWYENKAKLAWVIPILIAFNANLLYMLYHDFYGQVVFWGIELVIMVLFTVYINSKEKGLEWLLGGSIAAMYMAYHEPALFMLLPLVITAILKKNWQGMLRIAGITLLIAGISVFNAVIFDFGQAFQGNPNQPIGWQIFRTQSPMANPFEMLGLSSVHTASPLTPILAWGLSLICVVALLTGVAKSKSRVYTFSLAVIFTLMFYWTSLGKNGNWFVFNRAFTYVLPILIVMFIGGITQIRNRYVGCAVTFVILGLVTLQGYRLNLKLINNHLSVTAGYQTLDEVRQMKIKEPIYTTGMISPYTGLWDEIWIGYFLFPYVDDGTVPKGPIHDGDLALLNKSTPWVRYSSYLQSDTQWENQYYRLGRICLSDRCLSEHLNNLNAIEFGKSEFEDSLLLSGWSNPEKDGRWVEGKMAELKLGVGDDSRYNKLRLEAKAIAPNTRVEILVDGKSLGKIELGTDWQTSDLNIKILPGIHIITLNSNQATSPSAVGDNADARILSIRLKNIGLVE